MERFLDGLLRDLESGKMSRRQFCEAVALAAVVYAAGSTAAKAAAAPAGGSRVLAINHLTYDCPDYRPARDFYASTFGMENLREGQGWAHLAFGPAQGEGGGFLKVRTAAPAAPPPEALIDHVCWTIPDWDEARVHAALTARGHEPTGRPGSWHVYDPFDFDVQIGNAVEENAFRR